MYDEKKLKNKVCADFYHVIQKHIDCAVALEYVKRGIYVNRIGSI